MQQGELKKTQNVQRREKLLASFSIVAPDQFLTSGMKLNVNNWRDAEFAEDDLINRMSAVLLELDKKKRKGNTSYNHTADILIAATAIKKQLTLVTNDGNLRIVVQQFGGRAIDASEFGCTAEDGPHSKWKPDRI
jgi:predicted nucleic acid-binding protein